VAERRPLISITCVGIDKIHGTLARDFKDPKDKDREDLFSATPAIEMMGYMLSR
jgi:hypothetical protein